MLNVIVNEYNVNVKSEVNEKKIDLKTQNGGIHFVMPIDPDNLKPVPP